MNQQPLSPGATCKMFSNYFTHNANVMQLVKPSPENPSRYDCLANIINLMKSIENIISRSMGLDKSVISIISSTSILESSKRSSLCIRKK
ncbi:unnamed protein product [Blepharisma stoltei]|uniref:Uncharacterized protein n=1 Tax=Blepharisma stoltei TaxID=1481888 RepID=A0AAU9JEZ2_9CILI|nr:unnamed protein product [Blepharisma stoltei]